MAVAIPNQIYQKAPLRQGGEGPTRADAGNSEEDCKVANAGFVLSDKNDVTDDYERHPSYEEHSTFPHAIGVVRGE